MFCGCYGGLWFDKICLLFCIALWFVFLCDFGLLLIVLLWLYFILCYDS